jgi:hypothetical protein
LAAEYAGGLFNGLGERQLLEGVQGVVVNEYSNRALRREEVPGVLDALSQTGKIRVARARPGRRLFDRRDVEQRQIHWRVSGGRVSFKRLE